MVSKFVKSLQSQKQVTEDLYQRFLAACEEAAAKIRESEDRRRLQAQQAHP